jgi:hypothetical protein
MRIRLCCLWQVNILQIIICFFLLCFRIIGTEDMAIQLIGKYHVHLQVICFSRLIDLFKEIFLTSKFCTQCI